MVLFACPHRCKLTRFGKSTYRCIDTLSAIWPLDLDTGYLTKDHQLLHRQLWCFLDLRHIIPKQRFLPANLNNRTQVAVSRYYRYCRCIFSIKIANNHQLSSIACLGETADSPTYLHSPDSNLIDCAGQNGIHSVICGVPCGVAAPSRLHTAVCLMAPVPTRLVHSPMWLWPFHRFGIHALAGSKRLRCK